MPRIKDLTGTQINGFQILKLTNGRDKHGSVEYECRCVCGKVMVVSALRMRSGLTSCGCLRPSREDVALKSVLAKYRWGASVRDLDFNLTLDDFKTLVRGNCAYCARPPFKSHKSVLVNGIDRIDNALGYSVGNCVPCCTDCNLAKGVMSRYDFIISVQQIANHLSLNMDT